MDIGSSFEFLYRELKTEICGHPFCLFTQQLSPKVMHVLHCYPVIRSITKKNILITNLPGASVVSMIHGESRKSLGESWEILFDFIDRKNLITGPWRREIYLHFRPGCNKTVPVELQVSIYTDYHLG